MESNDIRRRIETKAFAYGVSECVATLLAEYVVHLLKDAEPRENRKDRIADDRKTACPLCRETMKYDESCMTHAWKCPMCPFVGFEYYNQVDIEHIATSLDAKFAPLTPSKVESDILLRLDVLEFKLDEIHAEIDLASSLTNDGLEKISREVSAMSEFRALIDRVAKK